MKTRRKEGTKRSARAEESSKPEEDAASATPLSIRRLVLESQVPFHEMLAVVLGLILFLRPWLDGITYPYYNTFFLLGIMLVFTLWAGSLLRIGRKHSQDEARVRSGKPIALFALFLVLGALSIANTVQKDATFDALLLWSGYLALFVVVSNVLRTDLAVAIVLGIFLTTCFLESAYSLVHLKYILPMTRAEVLAKPALRQLYFNSPAINAELIHRLNVNRAFGSLLFPNALAGFLLLTIPYAFAAIVPCWRMLKQAKTACLEDRNASGRTEPTYDELLQSVAAGAVTWFIAFVFFLVPVYFFFGAQRPHESWTTNPWTWIILVGVLPIASGTGVLLQARLYNLRVVFYSIKAVCFPILFALEVISLYYTFSRGGVMGLAGAVAVTLLLLVAGSRGSLPRFSKPVSVVALILVFGLVAGQAITANSSYAQPAAVETPPPNAGDQQVITVEGTDLTAGELANPASLRLRMSYWKTGLRMAADNFWTGVGFGNFGNVYPKYQYLGAAEVKMAHNDYLQIMCETGVFGLAAFCLFWLYVLIAGAKYVFSEKEPNARLLGAGIFCGLLAFLLHSVVDFNFYNPSLATPAFFMAGLLCSRAEREKNNASSTQTAESGGRFRLQVTAVAMLALAMFVVGSAVRVYRAESILPDKRDWPRYLGAAAFYTQEINPKAFDPKRPPQTTLARLLPLLPSRAELEKFAWVMVPQSSTPGDFRPLRSDEEMLNDQGVINTGIVLIRDPNFAQKSAESLIQGLIRLWNSSDALYPYDAEVAAALYQFHELLLGMTHDVEQRKPLVLKCQEWAEKAVERSPQQAFFREYYGKALWYRAGIERGQRALDFYNQGMEQYRRTTALSSTNVHFWDLYASALDEYSRAYDARGDTANSERYKILAVEVKKKADEVRAVIPGSIL